LGWDAHWYYQLAAHGYDGVPLTIHRFFPLLPLLTRGLAAALGGSGAAVAVALLLISNVCALGYTLAAYALARDAGLDERTARLVPWIIAFCPAGFVLVMGYTEPLFGITVCGGLLAARHRRWLLAALLGGAAGALRPTGVLLAVPLLVEAAIAWRRIGSRERVRALAAVVAPVAGLATFLLWYGIAFGDSLRPLRTQTQTGLRGGLFVNPVPTMSGAARALVDGYPGRAAPLLHVVWAGLALSALALSLRRLPLSYNAFSAVTLVLALTAVGMSSFERYAASGVGLLMTVASLLDSANRRRGALMIAAPILTAYSVIAFAHGYVP
jgi:hypothetical protein